MFALRVHSVDSTIQLAGKDDTHFPATKSTSSSQSNPYSNFNERRGIIHLFRTSNNTNGTPTTPRSSLLFVVAVPNYMSSAEFIRFCSAYTDSITQLSIIRNDGMEDRYSVVIQFADQLKAYGFYCSFNGNRFSPPENYRNTIPVKEQKTIPVKERVLRRGLPECRLCQQQDEKSSCFICGTLENLWVCLICGFVGCGRYKEGHAIRHWKNTEHCYSLDSETQQVWDYVGDTYVHRLNQSKADGKSAMMSSHCMSLEGNCGSCGCSKDNAISGALYCRKIEAITDEYNRLLAIQLETNRQYYESQLFEEKSKKGAIISEAVEQALTSKMQEMQDEIEKRVKEKKLVAEINQKLMNNQEVLRKNVKEMEERAQGYRRRLKSEEKFYWEVSLLRSKDEHMLDLEEQIRDLTIYIKAQKTIGGMTDTDDVREGTVLPVPMKQSSKTSTFKRQIKSNRRPN